MNKLYTASEYESRLWDGEKFLDYEPKYKLKIIKFADKTIDYVMSALKPLKVKERFYGMQTSYIRDLTDAELEFKRLENVERSARRAKQAVHHLVRQIGADHMLTLSTRENITDKDKFFEIFARFIRLVRTKQVFTKNYNGESFNILITKKIPSQYFYVATPELQERGAYHMHIACVGKQDISLLRACWYVALGGTANDKGEHVLGQIDVQSDKKRFSGETSVFKTFKLVSYLTKYVTKSFLTSDLMGEKRYSSSRGVPKPQIQKRYLTALFDMPIECFSEAMREVIYDAEFEGVTDYQLWNRGLDIFILRGVQK